MSNENANQPAYPIHPNIAESFNAFYEGLTNRELIAAMLMQGIISNESLRVKLLKDREADGTTTDNYMPVYATKQADELLKQLNHE